MTTQPIASSRPAASAPGPARQRRIRAAAAIAAVAALIATGGYLAITTSGPDATSPTPAPGTEVNTSAQTLREMRQSIAGQYGNQSAARAVVNPNAPVRRELRDSIAGQYRSRPAAGTVVNPSAQVRRELRDSIAGQYGPAS
jgi:HAMP domain-containing protein